METTRTSEPFVPGQWEDEMDLVSRWDLFTEIYVTKKWRG